MKFLNIIFIATLIIFLINDLSIGQQWDGAQNTTGNIFRTGSVGLETKSQLLSHPPIHKIPLPSQRPMDKGKGFFVDPAKGEDSNNGFHKKPWKTINHAMKQLEPGNVLYLRQGIYFEDVYCAVVGTAKAPIVIRSYSGELAIIDGGIPEFQLQPSICWRPNTKGAAGEFISAKAYKNIRNVIGLFGNSYIGLQTYMQIEDLRAANELRGDDPCYCGPGLWYNQETGYIHVRLAHTHIQASDPDKANYSGETDPSRLPLVIAPFNSVPLLVDLAKHIRFCDLVIRGGGYNSVIMRMGVNVDFENVTIYAGTYGVRASSSGPCRIQHCSIHGTKASWAFLQGRNILPWATQSALVTEGSYQFEVFYYPFNHDWVIAHNLFTDAHHGIYATKENFVIYDNKFENMPVFTDNEKDLKGEEK